MRRVIRRTVAVVACALALASPSARAEDKGKLLIIGGGMTAAMAPEIYGKLADLLPEKGVVGYLPTASEKAVKDDDALDNRLKNALKGRTLKLINLTQGNAAKADDPELAKQIESCDAVFFGGGAQSRIVKVFRPGGRETLASKAIDAILARGGVVAGTSAGAEIMSDPMIHMGESDKALAKPEGLPIGRGMGYFKYGMVDQHFLQRGRFGRLCVALERTNRNYGFGISEARALLVDRSTGLMTTIGPDAVVFIDRSKADGRSNWRVSLLGNGDTIDGKTGVVTSKDRGGQDGSIIDLPAYGPEVTDPWAKFAVSKLIHDMVRDIRGVGLLVDRTQTFRLFFDFDTCVRKSAKGDDICVVGLRMDIEPTPPDRFPTTHPTTAASRP